MKPTLCVRILLLVSLPSVLSEGKRKKIRRKIISTTTESSISEAKNETKLPRGFLDDYYSQFKYRLSNPKPARKRFIPHESIKRIERLPEKYVEYSQPMIKSNNGAKRNYDGGLSSLIPSPSLYSALAPSGSYNHVPEKEATDPISRFFGISGTSSQDIQLGLTFTLPFLSFPLSSINSIISGEGSGNIFNFSTQNLFIVTAIAFGAIFILPQFIYWMTGVNLSAFNWGRNDDSNELNSLFNIVDQALHRYDVDPRSCIAETICKKMRTSEENPSILWEGIIGLLLKSQLFSQYMGEERMRSIGKNKCLPSANCPWDIGPLTNFASQIIKHNGKDILSMAMNAIEN